MLLEVVAFWQYREVGGIDEGWCGIVEEDVLSKLGEEGNEVLVYL